MPSHFGREDFGKVLQRRKSSQGTTTETADHGQKNKNFKNPQKEKMPSFPGDFELLKLTLTSPNRKGYVDLKGAWSSLNIYEDVFANCLTGTIMLTDGVGLMEDVPIIGEETINIHLRTRGIKREREVPEPEGPFKGSGTEGIINTKFKVIRLTDLVKLNEGMVRYTLHLISEEYLINLKSKVMKTTIDPGSLEPRKISSLISQIYRQFFKRGRIAKKIFVEPTINLTNLIIPNYTPFKAFNFLASRAVSAGKHAAGSNFLFYETIKGFFFISLETLMAGGGTGYTTIGGAGGSEEVTYTVPEKQVKETYVVQPKRMNAKTDQLKNTAIEMTAVDEYKFTSNFDIVENLSKGMYANRLLTHDLVRMKYDTLDFNYLNPENLEQQVTIPQNTAEATEVVEMQRASKEAKNFFDQFTHLGKGRLCSENQFAMGSPESHLSFYPTNFAHDIRFKTDIGSKGVHGAPPGNLNIVPNRVEEWMQSRLVQSQQLNNIKINIRAPGLSTRTVGDLIEFKMPTSYLDDRDGKTASAHHKYLSGYYLITKLRHHFTREKYQIEFEAIKDALNTSVSSETSEADSPRANHTVS